MKTNEHGQVWCEVHQSYDPEGFTRCQRCTDLAGLKAWQDAKKAEISHIGTSA